MSSKRRGHRSQEASNRRKARRAIIQSLSGRSSSFIPRDDAYWLLEKKLVYVVEWEPQMVVRWIGDVRVFSAYVPENCPLFRQFLIDQLIMVRTGCLINQTEILRPEEELDSVPSVRREVTPVDTGSYSHSDGSAGERSRNSASSRFK